MKQAELTDGSNEQAWFTAVSDNVELYKGWIIAAEWDNGEFLDQYLRKSAIITKQESKYGHCTEFTVETVMY